MSIRPVDLQVMLPKTSEVSKTHNNENHRAETQHQQFAKEFQQRVEHETKQVIDTNKAEKRGVDKDGSNGSQYNARKKRQDEEDEKKKKEAAAQQNKGLLDITI